MQRFIVILIFGLIFLFSSNSFAYQPEEIQHFESNITINPDASTDIIETITVYANSDKIKRGITRWLPTEYKDSYGITHNAYYQIQKIEVNDVTSPYHIEQKDDRMVVYIGSKDIFLQPGFYVYRIQYHVNNTINFLKDADEFYWNITGNYWEFPIEKVTATVTLPSGAVIQRYAGYTGRLGEKQQDFSVNQESTNTITFETNRTLDSGENITVAISWPKGVIKQPTFSDILKMEFELNRSNHIIIEIILFSLLYYLLTWYTVGRDPKQGTIIPLFEPPQNLSPASLRYVHRMGFDMKTFTVAILSMASKGYLTIAEEKDKYTLTQVHRDNNQISASESAVAAILFKESASIKLSDENYKDILAAKSALNKSLKKECVNIYFVTNSTHMIPGILIGIVALFSCVITSTDYHTTGFLAVWLTIWTIACYFLYALAFTQFIYFWSNKTFKTFLSVIHSLFFAVIFSFGEVMGLYQFASTVSVITTTFLLIIIIMNIVFYHLLRKPTQQGRKILDEIEGFKQFLSITGKYEIAKMQPPEMSQTLFEKYLPYAVALDVENQWTEKFNQYLLLTHQPTSYTPVWYSGSNYSGTFSTAFVTGLSGGLSSTLSASSASGGSGGSGGGGGGGGGGGW